MVGVNEDTATVDVSSTLALASAILIGIGMGAESDVVPYLLTRYFGLEQFGALDGYTWCVYAPELYARHCAPPIAQTFR